MARKTEKEKVYNYSLINHVADLGADNDNTTAWVKEVNVMVWGKAKTPVIDIRRWNRTEEEPMPGKGISLSLSEFQELQNINLELFKDYFKEEE